MESQQQLLPEWETPAVQDIAVSAEASAYMDILEFDEE